MSLEEHRKDLRHPHCAVQYRTVAVVGRALEFRCIRTVGSGRARSFLSGAQGAMGRIRMENDGGSGGQIGCRYRRIRWKRNPSRSSFSSKGLLRTHHQGYRRQVIPFIRANFRGEGVRTVIRKGESKLWWIVGLLRSPISGAVSCHQFWCFGS